MNPREEGSYSPLQVSTMVVLGMGVGFAAGWMCGGVLRKASLISRGISGKLEGIKMVLVVRTDLEMTKGKASAQCAHAAVACYSQTLKTHSERLRIWEAAGQPKIVVKVNSEKMLTELEQQAKQVGLSAYIVHDAGKTQLQMGTTTVLGIGPGPSSLIDPITGHLKLW